MARVIEALHRRRPGFPSCGIAGINAGNAAPVIDATPTAFDFDPVTDAEPGEMTESNEVTPTAFNDPACLKMILDWRSA